MCNEIAILAQLRHPNVCAREESADVKEIEGGER
jgi:hypothetical protein